jgi:hypothetical protein
MRSGKIPSITSANATGVGTPDSSTFVFVYYESDTNKLCVKNSTGSVKKTPALV